MVLTIGLKLEPKPVFTGETTGGLVGWRVVWVGPPNKFIPKLFWAWTWGGGFGTDVGPDPKLNDGCGGAVTGPRFKKSFPNPVLVGWGCDTWGGVLMDPNPSKSPPKLFEGGWTTGWVWDCGDPISRPRILKGSLFFGAGGGWVTTGDSKLNPPNPVLKRLFCWFVTTGCLT